MSRSRLARIVLPAAGVVALAVLLATVVGDLPDPVAVHFGPDDQPDGFASHLALWVVFLLFPTALWAWFAAISRSTARGVGARVTAGLPLGIVTFFWGIVATTLLPQRGLADATAARLEPWALPVTILAGICGGIVGAWVAGRPATPDRASGPAPAGAVRTELGDGTAVWRGQTPTSPVLVVIAVAVLVAAAATWWMLDWVPAVVLTIVAGAVIATSRYDVTIGPGGIVLRGVLGWPRTSVPLATVASAAAGEARPVDYGGYGWRFRRDTTAVLTRSGPALLVHLTDATSLAVSLDDPEAAAGVVNSLLDRREATPDAADTRR